MERRINNPWTWQDQMGYVQANEVSGAQRTLFLAGQGSVDEEGRPVHPDDMGAQLNQTLDNLETVLREAGVSLSDVVRLNIYTTDVDRFFEVYGAAGRLAEAGCHPASTLLGVTRLAYPEMLVEIEATAVLYRPERSTKKPPGRDNPNRAGAAPVGYKVGPGSFGAFGSERAGAPKITHLGDALSLGRCQYDGAVGTTRQGKAGERRHAAMHERMSILEGPADQVDEGMRYVREQVLPLMQQQDGFKGFIVLNDRQSGKIIGVSFWESEQAMQASEEVGDRTRSESAEASGATVAGVERYEVELFEVSS